MTTAMKKTNTATAASSKTQVVSSKTTGVNRKSTPIILFSYYLFFFLVLPTLLTPASAQTAYITNYGDNTVSVINVATNTVTATITVGTHL